MFGFSLTSLFILAMGVFVGVVISKSKQMRLPQPPDKQAQLPSPHSPLPAPDDLASLDELEAKTRRLNARIEVMERLMRDDRLPPAEPTARRDSEQDRSTP